MNFEDEIQAWSNPTLKKQIDRNATLYRNAEYDNDREDMDYYESKLEILRAELALREKKRKEFNR